MWTAKNEKKELKAKMHKEMKNGNGLDMNPQN